MAQWIQLITPISPRLALRLKSLLAMRPISRLAASLASFPRERSNLFALRQPAKPTAAMLRMALSRLSWAFDMKLWGKWFIAFIVAVAAVALVISSNATDFPLGTVAFSQNTTLSIASPNTNATSSVLYVEKNCFHAIQVTLSTNLVSTASFVIDGSLDNTNWVPLTTTNTIANTGGT